MQSNIVHFVFFAGWTCSTSGDGGSHFLPTPQVSFHPPICTKSQALPTSLLNPGCPGLPLAFFSPFLSHLTTGQEPPSLGPHVWVTWSATLSGQFHILLTSHPESQCPYQWATACLGLVGAQQGTEILSNWSPVMSWIGAPAPAELPHTGLQSWRASQYWVI